MLIGGPRKGMGWLSSASDPRFDRTFRRVVVYADYMPQEVRAHIARLEKRFGVQAPDDLEYSCLKGKEEDWS